MEGEGRREEDRGLNLPRLIKGFHPAGQTFDGRIFSLRMSDCLSSSLPFSWQSVLSGRPLSPRILRSRKSRNHSSNTGVERLANIFSKRRKEETRNGRETPSESFGQK